ncbi:MAG: glycosyltransferase family 1 protein [Candidatus Thermofonsia Clade 1 bacterium]|jgi:glycosyltransferase involved in cell wall biosynthesis|uniref:Glycosyltransferase family 1 protein n=1 Tax=Candidatus Thermofonsia Clade 1 bacterium TaxID=2364210 RepID=A0A2M8PFN6_9CHLR|nr:MAG: glycosyltransferase family 1 protein [Candidatus Thermofonsia Clade 1 bacterium]RMF53040.1 MAG: glycosyltransferase family 1 protein [Chloroflexota bacterium]
MHIALNAWFWNQPHTGSGQYIRELVRALWQLRRDDSRYAKLQLSLIAPERGAALEAVPEGVRVVRVRASGGQLGKVIFEQRTFPQVAGALKADIAHVPYWAAPLSSPVRLVVTIHDVIPLSMPIYQGGLGGRLYFGLVRASAMGVAHIITDSEFSKAEIVRHIGVPAEMVTAIPLAVAEVFHPRLGAERDSEVRRKYNLPENYALYLGGFDVRKNLRALIAAYTYVGPSVGDEYPLILAGKPPKRWGTARFPDLPAEIAAREGLGQWIRWLGEVAEEDKPSLYRMARLFVMPSRYEGFGLGVLEAMACGTPVVAAEASSLPEVVGDAAYLVAPHDSRQLGGAIIAVLIQDDLHASLKNLGLARASNFSWERTARQTYAVYEQVMAS